MSAEENKAIVRQFFEAFQTNDQTTLKKLLAPDLVAYLPGSPDPLSREVHLDIIRRWNGAFNNLHFAVENQIAEGDMVATHTTLRGVHSRGDFLELAPSGRQIAISVMTIERIEGGKIAERRVVLDVLSLMHQLGASPTPGEGVGWKRLDSIQSKEEPADGDQSTEAASRKAKQFGHTLAA